MSSEIKAEWFGMEVLNEGAKENRPDETSEVYFLRRECETIERRGGRYFIKFSDGVDIDFNSLDDAKRYVEKLTVCYYRQ